MAEQFQPQLHSVQSWAGKGESRCLGQMLRGDKPSSAEMQRGIPRSSLGTSLRMFRNSVFDNYWQHFSATSGQIS